MAESGQGQGSLELDLPSVSTRICRCGACRRSILNLLINISVDDGDGETLGRR
jgi:hypothetical protein